jgi:hypothetical protein
VRATGSLSTHFWDEPDPKVSQRNVSAPSPPSRQVALGKLRKGYNGITLTNSSVASFPASLGGGEFSCSSLGFPKEETYRRMTFSPPGCFSMKSVTYSPSQCYAHGAQDPSGSTNIVDVTVDNDPTRLPTRMLSYLLVRKHIDRLLDSRYTLGSSPGKEKGGGESGCQRWAHVGVAACGESASVLRHSRANHASRDMYWL